MKVWYEEGELKQSFGEAGEFVQGVPKDIPDNLANALIGKGRVKAWPEPDTDKKIKLVKS